MHMTKAEGRTIELSVENLTYIHTDEDDQEEEKSEVAFEDMDEVARNLFIFRLDHDYTPLTSPKQSPIREPEPVDELAETLSLLDGGIETLPIPVQKTNVKNVSKVPVIKKTSMQQQLQMRVNQQEQLQSQPSPQKLVKTPDVKPQQQKTRQAKAKTKEVEETSYDEEDENYEEEIEDDNDENDSDFELEEPKPRMPKRSQRIRSIKSIPETKKTVTKSVKTPTTPKAKILPVTPTKLDEEEKPSGKQQSIEMPTGSAEKKQAKKEKKPPKPIPDDFALFSTPDIIRRVGGKDQLTPTTPEPPPTPKPPAKISPESRSKSNTEQRTSINQKTISTRLSVDSKTVSAPSEKAKGSTANTIRRTSTDKGTKTTVDAQKSTDEVLTQNVNDANNSTDTAMEVAPLVEDTLNEHNKTFPTTSLSDISMVQQSMEPSNMSLETGGLDLDQSILDNINSDMISDDILYQVAKQLVDNTDLQNAIDKSLAEGNLVLDPSLISGGQDVIPQTVQQNNEVSSMHT